jgi:hypothetical protein
MYLTPVLAEEEENQPKVFAAHMERYNKIVSKRKLPKYQVGQIVLVKKLPTKFDRGYEQTFNKEQFEIVEVRTRMPIPMYILKSLNKNDIIEGGELKN